MKIKLTFKLFYTTKNLGFIKISNSNILLTFTKTFFEEKICTKLLNSTFTLKITLGFVELFIQFLFCIFASQLNILNFILDQ